VGGTSLDDQVVAIAAAVIGYDDGVQGGTVDPESLQVIPLVADLPWSRPCAIGQGPLAVEDSDVGPFIVYIAYSLLAM